jgi:hypothetical protein
MREALWFPDLNAPLAESSRRDVAVFGGDVTAVFAAAILARRGHRVVWYRGDKVNPHAGSGVIRDYAAEPLALPGYPLSLARRFFGNAARGGLTPAADPRFLAWVLRAVASSRPLESERIAADRAWLLAQARPAFAALAAAERFDLDTVEVLTLYRDARAFAAGWADTTCAAARLRPPGTRFAEIEAMCPRLSAGSGAACGSTASPASPMPRVCWSPSRPIWNPAPKWRATGGAVRPRGDGQVEVRMAR